MIHIDPSAGHLEQMIHVDILFLTLTFVNLLVVPKEEAFQILF